MTAEYPSKKVGSIMGMKFPREAPVHKKTIPPTDGSVPVMFKRFSNKTTVSNSVNTIEPWTEELPQEFITEQGVISDRTIAGSLRSNCRFKVNVRCAPKSGATACILRFVHEGFYPDTDSEPAGWRKLFSLTGKSPPEHLPCSLALDDFIDSQVDGYIVLYSVESRSSFQQIKTILGSIQEHKSRAANGKVVPLSDIPFVIVANKIDLKHNVPLEEGEALAKSLGVPFIAASCLTATNVKVIMYRIIGQILLKRTQTIRIPREFLPGIAPIFNSCFFGVGVQFNTPKPSDYVCNISSIGLYALPFSLTSKKDFLRMKDQLSQLPGGSPVIIIGVHQLQFNIHRAMERGRFSFSDLLLPREIWKKILAFSPPETAVAMASLSRSFLMRLSHTVFDFGIPFREDAAEECPSAKDLSISKRIFFQVASQHSAIEAVNIARKLAGI